MASHNTLLVSPFSFPLSFDLLSLSSRLASLLQSGRPSFNLRSRFAHFHLPFRRITTLLLLDLLRQKTKVFWILTYSSGDNIYFLFFGGNRIIIIFEYIIFFSQSVRREFSLHFHFDVLDEVSVFVLKKQKNCLVSQSTSESERVVTECVSGLFLCCKGKIGLGHLGSPSMKT